MNVALILNVGTKFRDEMTLSRGDAPDCQPNEGTYAGQKGKGMEIDLEKKNVLRE